MSTTFQWKFLTQRFLFSFIIFNSEFFNMKYTCSLYSGSECHSKMYLTIENQSDFLNLQSIILENPSLSVDFGLL